MQESYKVRPSQSPWHRVMRRVGGYPVKPRWGLNSCCSVTQGAVAAATDRWG
jgi:hypothetical protein